MSLPVVVSESRALSAAIQHITNGEPGEAIALLRMLREQASRGLHKNPSESRMYTPFKIVGVIGTDVHFVAYQHADDGENYKHDFKGGNAEVLAVIRHGKKELLITSPTGKPLWEEFD